MSKTITIALGFMAKELDAQINEQGFVANADDIHQWQRNADAIDSLYLCGLLTKAESDRARGRLVKEIAKGVEERA